MSVTIHCGDALAEMRKLPSNSVDCCVTSPPYWGLRDYGVEGQIGLEPTPDAWCSKLVAIFREVRRVLKPTGTCWINVGDAYCNTDKWGGGGGNIGKQITREDGSVPSWDTTRKKKDPIPGIKPKDLVGQPWMLAFALRADGWYLRRDIIWHKPNCMPESAKDRPTTAHEYLFLLSKSEHYYYDATAIMEPTTGNARGRGSGVNPKAASASSRMMRDRDPAHQTPAKIRAKQNRSFSAAVAGIVDRRNARSVWSIPTAPYRGAHFATFPPRLAERCILAGSSAYGCCSWCGAPWTRCVDVAYVNPGNRSTNGPRSAERKHVEHGSAGFTQRLEAVRSTTGWRASCACTLAAGDPMPAVVLDPFAGASTTLLVAERLGRDAIGIEISAAYCAMAEERLRQGRNRQNVV